MSVQFDLSNFNSSGFAVIPPGRYQAKTEGWLYWEKQETGNIVLGIDVEFTEGEYKGESRRYFHVITQKDASKGYFFRLLTALGILQEGDRGDNGELNVGLEFGGTDDNGRTEVTAITVNGEQRDITKSIPCTAVVTNQTNDQSGEKQDWVNRLEQPEKKGKGKTAGKPF